MNQSMIRYGFILILLALVSGLFIPVMEIPTLGRSAHTVGILSGILLIAIGAIWPQFSLTSRSSQVMYWSWLFVGYINWLGILLGAVFGVGGRTMPVAAGGAAGPAAAEAVVSLLLISVAVMSFVAVGLSIRGLRPPRAESA